MLATGKKSELLTLKWLAEQPPVIPHTLLTRLRWRGEVAPHLKGRMKFTLFFGLSQEDSPSIGSPFSVEI